MGYFQNYTKEEIEAIVKLSVSYKDFARKLGYSHAPSGDTIKMLKNKLSCFDTSHFNTEKNNFFKETSDEEIFIENSTASQSCLRKRYLKRQHSEYVCSICKQQPYWNGAALVLILDHINGINNDNRLQNLRWVCPNCNQQLPTTGSRNPNRKVFAKKFYCIDCGKEISKNSNRCLQCQSKNRIIPNEQLPCSREQLKNLIRSLPFTQIGKKFGVTDNAIRKWCDKLGLPRKKTEIQLISDEEWAKI